MPDGHSPHQFPPEGTTLRDTAALVAAGLISPAEQAGIEAVAARYAIAIPPALRALIGGDPQGPIGRQFIPHADELRPAPHESADPIGDDALSPVAGIVHRYPDRVLLKPLLICPTYCRFCFRREHVGPDGGLLSPAQLDAALGYIAGQPGVREVILTGGDPFMLSARRLAAIVRALSALPQIAIIRVHTRVPVAEPALVTPELADALETDRGVFVVLHANHEDELGPACAAALRILQARAIPVLSQTVLLRGVNDSEAALGALFQRLLRLRVKPYYLHQLDRAPGTSRFEVPREEGRALLAGLRGRISGMALPAYVFDTPAGKRPIG